MRKGRGSHAVNRLANDAKRGGKAKGNIGKVIGIYPQGIRPIYEITLSDRTKIRVFKNG